MKRLVSDIPGLSSQYKGDLLAPEEQRAGNKPRQAIEDKGEEERKKEERDRGHLDRLEKDATNRQIAVYKGCPKGGGQMEKGEFWPLSPT